MIYDLASNQLLIGFRNSLTICNLSHVEGLKSEDRTFNCDDVIGGLAFLMAGTGCIVSIPKWQRMWVATLGVPKFVGLTFVGCFFLI
jgi:hypothetical protein